MRLPNRASSTGFRSRSPAVSTPFRGQSTPIMSGEPPFCGGPHLWPLSGQSLRQLMVVEGKRALHCSIRHSYYLRWHGLGIDAGAIAHSIGHLSFQSPCRRRLARWMSVSMAGGYPASASHARLRRFCHREVEGDRQRCRMVMGRSLSSY